MKSSEFDKVAILSVDCGWKVGSRVNQYTSRRHIPESAYKSLIINLL